MSATTTKRGRGRPRNEALDALQAELAVSRRRASSVLREMKSTPASGSENSAPFSSKSAANAAHFFQISEKSYRPEASGSENSAPGLSPLAAARLEKILKETRLLESKIRSAELEQRALEGELLYASEARELLNAVLGPLVDRLRTMPKTLSPRIVHQPQRAVESTLTDFANDMLEASRRAVTSFKGADREL